MLFLKPNIGYSIMPEVEILEQELPAEWADSNCHRLLR